MEFIERAYIIYLISDQYKKLLSIIWIIDKIYRITATIILIELEVVCGQSKWPENQIPKIFEFSCNKNKQIILMLIVLGC